MWGGAVFCGAALFVSGRGLPQHPLRVTLVAPASVRQGKPVPVTLRLTNTSDAPVTVYLTGRTITFDIIVERAGEVVWRRLDHVATQQIVQVKTLAPGETLELRARWRAAAPPGNYTVTGVIPTDREPLRAASVSLRIKP